MTHYCDHVVKEFPEFIDRFAAEKTRLCARANVGTHYSVNFQKYPLNTRMIPVGCVPPAC